MKNFVLVSVLCASIGFSLASTASATNLGVANDYNLFVFNDFYAINGSDSEGNVAIGGNAYISSYSVGSKINPGSNAKLVVDGNLTWQSGGSIGSDSKGTAYVGGTANIPDYFSLNNTQNIVDFSAVEKYLSQASSAWSTQTTNGTIDSPWTGGLFLTGTSSTLNVFNINIDGVDINTLKIFAPSGSTVLVNVSGSNVSMDNFGMSLANGIDANHVLFNFSQATSLTLGGCGFEGSILAPNAQVNFLNGNINGTLIANSVGQPGSHCGEVHNVPFQGELPNVPEPGTVLLLLTGAIFFIRSKIA